MLHPPPFPKDRVKGFSLHRQGGRSFWQDQAVGDSQAEINPLVMEVRLRIEEEFIPGLLTAQELFRERGAVVGNVGLLAHQENRTVGVLLPQLLGGLTGS